MYFSQYKRKKRRKSSSFGNTKGIYSGVVRFLKLATIIVSIIPAFYLTDRVYKIVRDMTFLYRYFEIRSIHVHGNYFVTEEELAPLLKEIQGRNIFRVNIKDIAERIRRHPWIKDVAVRRELPSAMFIDIVERTPAVYLNSGDRLYLADEEGVLLGDKKVDLLNLPIVYGIDLSDSKIGEKRTQQALLSAIEAKKELSTVPWIDLSSAGIEVKERGQIVLHLKGYRIKLGRGRYKEKLDRFYDIAKNLQEKGISYKEVDLRFENQVIVNTAGT